MTEMNFQQKAEALNALSPISIELNGKVWRVHNGMEIKAGRLLESVCGSGSTPNEALSAHWKAATHDLSHDQSIVLNAASPETRREVRWNGFMWEDVA